MIAESSDFTTVRHLASAGQQRRYKPTTRGSFAGVTQKYVDKKPAQHTSHTFSEASGVATVTKKGIAFEKPCLYCQDKAHSLEACQVVSSLIFKDRLDFLRSNGLCFGCLRLGHQKHACRSKAKCCVCKFSHPTILHIKRIDMVSTVGSSDSVSSSSQIQSHMVAGNSDCTFAILPVNIRLRNSCTTVKTYAFLDNGSNVSFCSERLMTQLGATGKKLRITVDTMGVPHKMTSFSLKGLLVSDLDNRNSIQLNTVYTKSDIPVLAGHIPTQDDISAWPHLSDIQLPQIDGDIGLLIGNNIADAYTPLDVRTGPRGSPHATKTRLGWVIWNLHRRSSNSGLSVNRAHLSFIEQIEDDKRLERLFQQSMTIDFPERMIDDRREDSVEDKMFRLKVEQSISLVNGHYQLALPFRDSVRLPNNEVQALQRLQSLKKKLEKNPDFHKDYNTFMETVFKNHYAEQVPDEDLSRNDGKVWYIPHHGVYHPHKPGKIRVVFDCAAKHFGISLNSVLLQGPDLTSSLLGVLMKFREESVAVMADIEAMYYQVRVPKDDIDCLRFFWWPQGNTSKQHVACRMLVHLFGATSSPTCSTVALQRTALDHKNSFSQEICNSVRHNFYVDDFLKSVPTVDLAVSLVQDMTDICSKGGFRLTKWCSNARDVIHSIPVEERAKQLKVIELDKEGLPAERALGIQWMVEEDQFSFKVAVKSLVPTRRHILSIVSSVFDPLGFVSPFTLTAKLILQDLCRRGISWDQESEGDDLRKWQLWLSELSRLDQVQIDRCLKPVGFGEVTECQIHHFADASDYAYGVVSYVRFKNVSGDIHCALILSKSRVNPLKKPTIPRLELTAATVAVRIQKLVADQVNYKVDSVYFWTDSMTVLRYLRNVSTRFHTFVANRVTLIREASDIAQWRFVGTAVNPADAASRGLSVDALLESNTWYQGPHFLWQPESEWPDQPCMEGVPSDDVEVKKVNIGVTERDHVAEDVTSRCIRFFSKWMRLKKFVAWVLIMKKCLRSWVSRRKGLLMELMKVEDNSARCEQIAEDNMKKYKVAAMSSAQQRVRDTQLTTDLLNEAEQVLCMREQQHHFKDELNRIECRKVVSKNSKLYRLDPIIKDGLLRVGGRLDRAVIPYDSKHDSPPLW
jgi:hypothetical protein